MGRLAIGMATDNCRYRSSAGRRHRRLVWVNGCYAEILGGRPFVAEDDRNIGHTEPSRDLEAQMAGVGSPVAPVEPLRRRKCPPVDAKGIAATSACVHAKPNESSANLQGSPPRYRGSP